MKTITTLKLTSAAILTLALSSGFALAGEGHKDCDKSKTKTTAQMSTPSTTASYGAAATTVAASSERGAKKKMKVLSFDEALELCTSKNASNLQACIDKKTGKTKPAT